MHNIYDIDHWKAVLKQYAHDKHIVKAANIGGDGGDTNFEQAFSNLAHAYIKDKAPSLLDHELGFQLVDRNDDNTKAVGIFAFKVGTQRVYAPVFFLKGELKGHELLYLKKQDIFIPLKENWLNYILQKKPNILGSGTTDSMHELGVTQPDLTALTESPSKYASVIQPFMPVLGHLATNDISKKAQEFQQHCIDRLDLTHFMKQASLPALASVVSVLQKKPRVAIAIDKWHGLSTLRDSIKEAKSRLADQSILDNPFKLVYKNQPKYGDSILEGTQEKTAQISGKIKIIRMSDTYVSSITDDFSEDDKERLLLDDVLIQDSRDDSEVSTPVEVKIQEGLMNPDITGIYDVLINSGEFKKCLVVVNPHTDRGKIPSVIVIDTKDNNNWIVCDNKEVFVHNSDQYLSDDEWEEWLKDNAKVKKPTVSQYPRDEYIALTPQRDATAPFSVCTETGPDSYTAEFSHIRDPNDYFSHGVNTFYAPETRELYDKGDRARDTSLFLNAKHTKNFQSSQGDVYIPECAYLLKLGDGQCKLSLGSMRDATRAIFNKTAGLRILSTGDRYKLDDGNLLNKTDAVISLVTDYGLREKQSRYLLEKADKQKIRNGTPIECRIKQASPYLTDNQISAPVPPDNSGLGGNIMGYPGNAVTTDITKEPVAGLASSNTDPAAYSLGPENSMADADINSITQAAASGQKEIFDTSMIGAMLKTVRDDTMIDRYIPDLVKAIDKLGRLIFMFYWHQSKFGKRYGKQDLVSLEDSLRNAFEMLGDVVLFLKQKTIEPYPEDDMQSIELDNVAEV